MSEGTNDKFGFLRQVDLLVLFGALLALFVALGSEPWWTLTGTATSNLLSIQVSPFYLHINALGLPSTMPAANTLGSFTRVLLILGSMALFAASVRPTAWWRNLAVYLGLCSLAELYLSFALIHFWAETTIVQAYGVVPPYFGTSVLQGSILGLDLRYYSAPLVTATFYFPFYLSLLGIALVLGRGLIKTVHERAFQVLSALLPGGGIHDVYLTPPYQHVWFSSGDKEFNPMRTDPEGLNDDELLVSFEKLYKTVEAGGSVSIILPAWATGLDDRLEKLMPQTGFILEKTGVIYRTQGKPENELRFRKPVQQEEATSTPQRPVLEEQVTLVQPVPPAAIAESALDSVAPPVLEIEEEPAWTHVKMSRLERETLKVAIANISAHREPVPYRELVNQVYMELVERKIDFDSARQIEATLLDHNGRELLLIDETDEDRSTIVKKWWLGEKKMRSSRHPDFSSLHKISAARPKMPTIHRLLKKWQRQRYRPKSDRDEDANN